MKLPLRFEEAAAASTRSLSPSEASDSIDSQEATIEALGKTIPRTVSASPDVSSFLRWGLDESI